MTKKSIPVFETIIEEMLGVLDDHEVSLEDGVTITANLYMMSLFHLNKDEEKSLKGSLTKELEKFALGGHGSIIPHNMIGINRGWGMDSALLDEEN